MWATRAVYTDRMGSGNKCSLALFTAWFISMGLLVSAAVPLQISLNFPFDLFAFVALAPAIACSVVLVFRRWLPEVWQRVPVRQVLISSGLACISVVVGVALFALATGRAPQWNIPTAGAPLALFLCLQVLGAFTEEVGWRGLAQHCCEQHLHPAVTAAILGFVFGLLHFGFWPLGVLTALTFATTAMFLGLTITTIYSGSFWQRMIPATIVHFGVNMALVLFAPGDVSFATSPQILGVMVAILAVAVAGRMIVRRAWTS